VTVLGIVAVVLAGIGLAASVALNSMLAHRKDKLLAQLSEQLGRQVTVAKLKASLWRGASVTAEQVTIAGDPSTPGDQAPLLQAERVRVRVSIGRALVTLGRRVLVKEVSVRRPTVNLVRFKDGTLNVEHLAARMERPKPAAPSQPMSPRLRQLIETARIAQARLEQGRVRFTDLQQGGRTVDVNDLDLVLDDVGVRSRPSLLFRAAVNAAQPNLELRAQLGEAGRLEKLPPPIESVKLKVDRAEVGPLLPLVTGGPAVEARLDADLIGNLRHGDLDVRKLELALGNMSLVGHGRLVSLTGTPRFERFLVESHGLDFDALRALDPRLDRQLGAVVHGPAQLRAEAVDRDFTVETDLTGTSIAASGTFDKPRGTPLKIEARGRAVGDGLDVQSLTVQLAGLKLDGGGSVRRLRAPEIDVHASVEGASVAALSSMLPSLAKAGLPPILASMKLHAKGRTDRLETMSATIDPLDVRSRKSDLTGSVAVRDFKRPQVDLRARSSYLDTADFLPPTTAPAATAKAPAPAEKAPTHGPAPRTGQPTALAKVSGHATLNVARGVAEGMPFDALAVAITLHDGALHADQMAVSTFGGRVAGDGSDYDLGHTGGPFHVVAQASNVDVEAATKQLAKSERLMRGRLTSHVDVRGHGATSSELEKSLDGKVDGTVEQAQLLGFNLESEVAQKLMSVLPFKLPVKPIENATNLGTVRFKMKIADGAVTLEEPLTADSSIGELALRGRAFLDGRLDLTGSLGLAPRAASAMFLGKVKLGIPLPLSLKIGGDVHHPQLGIANLGDAGKTLLRSTVGGLATGAGTILKGVTHPQDTAKQLEDAGSKLKGMFHK